MLGSKDLLCLKLEGVGTCALPFPAAKMALTSRSEGGCATSFADAQLLSLESKPALAVWMDPALAKFTVYRRSSE
jgi:hypothetical protein